jgi:KTSC domain
LPSERRLQFQNSTKGDAGSSNQGGAFHFGSFIRVKPRKTAGYLSASKRKVHSDRLGMLVRDQFTTPLAFLEGVRARVVEIRVATLNTAVAQNNYAGGMASLPVSHFNAYRIQSVLYFHNLGARSWWFPKLGVSMQSLLFALITSFSGATWADAETIDVKYYGKLDLAPFACTDVTRSSLINRACYDKSNQFMVVQLKTVYYPYCEMSAATYQTFLNAPSMGQYYKANIQGTGSDSPFDCRKHRGPKYRDARR